MKNNPQAQKREISKVSVNLLTNLEGMPHINTSLKLVTMNRNQLTDLRYSDISRIFSP